MVQWPDTAARDTSIGQSGSGRDARKDPVGLCRSSASRQARRAPRTFSSWVKAFNSPFKAEPIGNKGPWTGINDVEVAVAEYVDRRNQRRLHGELGHITPAEHKAAHYATEPPASLQRTS